jgi:molybdenum cofactor guanylyltransferase
MSRGEQSNLTLAILAGGQSRRMGQDKAWMLLAGKPLIQHVIDNLAPLHTAETLVITRHPAHYRHLPVRAISDLIPNCGPLGGLHTALTLAQHEQVALVGCDMPFADAALFARLCTLLAETGADVAVPRWHDQPEPLHAVYYRRALPSIEAQLHGGALSMMTLLDKLHVAYLDADDGLPFMNLNTPDDFAQATALLANIVVHQESCCGFVRTRRAVSFPNISS